MTLFITHGKKLLLSEPDLPILLGKRHRQRSGARSHNNSVTFRSRNGVHHRLIREQKLLKQ